MDAGAIAKAMSERFRQQISATGLLETATLLQGSVSEVKGLAEQISTALKPVPQQYKSIGATIATELAKLQIAASQLQQHNACLIVEAERNSWLWKALAVSVVFLVGILCGVIYEQDQKPECPAVVQVPVQQQNPPALRTAPAACEVRTRRSRRKLNAGSRHTGSTLIPLAWARHTVGGKSQPAF